MAPNIPSDAERQKAYYSKTAGRYDEMHVNEKDEHFFTLSFMASILDHVGIGSILDIGSGTGRTIHYVNQRRPDVRILGIEPVAELREAGYASGIPREALIDGDALSLPFGAGAFDLVCAFGVLHHVRTPDRVVAEMLRVGRKAIFISDANNFGQGTMLARAVKQVINALGLWKAADLIRTRGRGHTMSEGDGLAYSYSVFNNYKQIQDACRAVHVLNSVGDGRNPYRRAGHVALLGIKP